MTKQLSSKTKWLYGFGDVGFSLTSTILHAYYAIYMTDVVGLKPGLVAVAILIGRVWDFINDPLIGHISDRTRSKWGRRRPFLLFGPLPFALAFIMLWVRPPWDAPWALVAYYAVAYVFFDAAATFVYMPYYALTPELTDDYDERTALTSYRMFFSIVGSLIAFIVPIMIIGSLTPENASRVTLMGIIFGLGSGLPLLGVFFGTRERSDHIATKRPKLLKSFQSALKNRPFVFGAIIFLITWVSVDILQTILLYYIKYVVERESQSDLIMLAIFATAIIALPLWEWASRRWNKRWAYVAGIAFWAAVQMVLISLDAASPMSIILFFCVLAGIGVSAAHVLPWAIIPDAIEWDEWKTGERHEGMFYSLITLMQKVASAAAVPLALLVLDATGYVPTALVQPDSAVWGIRIVTGPIPAVLLTMGIFFAIKYPLSRDEFTQLVKDLETRRASRQKETA